MLLNSPDCRTVGSIPAKATKADELLNLFISPISARMVDRVLSGESEYEEVNGNVCCSEISPKTTKVYDNLAEDAMGNWCEVDTKELRQLIDEWCDKVRKFKNEHHN